MNRHDSAGGARSGSRVVALVAARNEAERIGETVAALRSIPGVSEVVVADDASTDRTAELAEAAGARVLSAPFPLGKGAVLEGALLRTEPADVWLLADGDLGGSAAALVGVLEVVRGGSADLAIALPPAPPTGGFGMVKRLSARLVRAISGFEPHEPLSGQRAVTAEALEACRPLAPGFGVETGMTADAVRTGFRVVEVAAAVKHRFTGRDLAGSAHRAHQGLDVLRAAFPRLIGLR